jgi:predicted RNase H-like HicB family nuclease/DNA-binding Xre family transcriptional regulator
MKYLAVIGKIKDSNYVGFFADPIPALAAADTREETVQQLSEMLLDAFVGTSRNVEPQAQSIQDVDPEALEGYDTVETVWVELGYINPMAQQIWDALTQANVRPAELARRMGVSRAAVSKLLDPSRTHSYSLETLERVAAALDMRLEPPRFVSQADSFQRGL